MNGIEYLESIIAEQTRRLADREEEIARLKSAHECNVDTLNAMQIEVEQRDAEITRLKALCQEPVTLSDNERAEICHHYFPSPAHGIVEATQLINAKLKERK
jgi:hypothetical protein